MEHGPISNAQTDAEIGSVEQGVHFVHREVADERDVSPLLGNRENAAALLQERRHAIFAKAHKRFDRGQSDIACAWTVTPLGFQMVKKRQHQWGIDLFELWFSGIFRSTKSL